VSSRPLNGWPGHGAPVEVEPVVGHLEALELRQGKWRSSARRLDRPALDRAHGCPPGWLPAGPAARVVTPMATSIDVALAHLESSSERGAHRQTAPDPSRGRELSVEPPATREPSQPRFPRGRTRLGIVVAHRVRAGSCASGSSSPHTLVAHQPSNMGESPAWPGVRSTTGGSPLRRRARAAPRSGSSEVCMTVRIVMLAHRAGCSGRVGVWVASSDRSEQGGDERK
jgi:hypothetical protein